MSPPRGLAELLRAHKRLAFDTSTVIYHVEGNSRHAGVVEPLFRWVESARGSAVTSTITMLEVLVQPYRLKDFDRVNRFFALLSTYPHLEWVAPGLEIADRAAHLRAEHNLKTPDAIQLATALSSRASGFVTNDPAFRRVRGLDVLVIDDLLAGGS